MSDDGKTQVPFFAAKEFSRIEAFCVSSGELSTGSHRLQGDFYGDAGYRAKRSMDSAGFPSRRLEDLADVYWPGQGHSYEDLKRTYVDDPTTGVPFLSTSEMLLARFEGLRLVSRPLSSHFTDLIVNPGCILVSRSGTIGRAVIATSDFEGKYVSDDALRVNAREADFRGPLFAFVQSEAGQFLITRNKSGGVVEHIYASDLASLDVPLLPKSLRVEITRLVDRSCCLRVNANELLSDADQLLSHQALLEPLPPKRDGSSSFVVQAKNIKSVGQGATYKGSIRLDVSAFHPRAETARTRISRKQHARLGDVVDEVLYIGKVFRNFIDDSALGVALISGKDLVMFHPPKDKYLSTLNRDHIEKCKVKRGWILISRSGNIGRVAMVHRNFEDSVASEHILRLVPSENGLDPYFLSAFLSSEYGQAQIESLQYGSVIITMNKEQLSSILVPVPADNGEAVGEIVRTACDDRAESRELESQAVELFETAIQRGRDYTEAEWGSEY